MNETRLSAPGNTDIAVDLPMHGVLQSVSDEVEHNLLLFLISDNPFRCLLKYLPSARDR